MRSVGLDGLIEKEVEILLHESLKRTCVIHCSLSLWLNFEIPFV